MAQSAAIKRLLSRVQVRHLIPYSDSQIYRLEQQDRFPRRLRIGPNRVAWLEDEISNWLQQRIDDRRKTQPVHNSQQFATMNRREEGDVGAAPPDLRPPKKPNTPRQR